MLCRASVINGVSLSILATFLAASAVAGDPSVMIDPKDQNLQSGGTGR